MTRERLTFGQGEHIAVPAQVAVAAARLADEPRPVRLSNVQTWDWGWGGLLIFTVLLFFRPQDQIPGLKNSHLSDIAALLGLAAMVSVNLSRGRPITRMTPELLGVFGLGAVILLTVPTSFWISGAFAQFRDLFVPVALISMLMVNTLTSPKRIERICWIIVLAFGYMSALVLFNYARGVNMMEDRVMGPVGGFFQNPNDLALNLAAFLPLAMMNVRRPGPVFPRVVSLGISVMMLVAMVLTQSRGGTLGTVAMLVTFIIVGRLLTPATVIAGILAGIVALPLIPSSYWERMASITDGRKDETGSRAERKMLLKQGWAVFLDHPLTGVGMGQFKNYYQPGLGLRTRWHETHNVLLQVAAETGIFGLVAFVFLIVRAVSGAWWTRRHLSWIFLKRSRKRQVPEPEDGLDDNERHFLHSHGSAMVACAVGWLVCAMFASVAFNWSFYYVLGLSAASREVVRARAAAYAKAKRLAAREVAAA